MNEKYMLLNLYHILLHFETRTPGIRMLIWYKLIIGSFGAFWNQFKIILDHMGPSWTIYDNLGQFGVIFYLKLLFKNLFFKRPRHKVKNLKEQIRAKSSIMVNIYGSAQKTPPLVQKVTCVCYPCGRPQGARGNVEGALLFLQEFSVKF